MHMPKLIVCGDSFMTPITTYPGTHFSEIVAERLGFELTAYSRGGMSNGGIAIQIDTAIKENPDLILVGTSLPDRIEYTLKSGGDCSPEFTVKDIQYKHWDSVSSHYPWLNADPRLVSANLVELIGDTTTNPKDYAVNIESCDEPFKTKQAINDWFRYIYHPGWKIQTDQWMMYAMLHKLHLSGIPYILCIDNLNVEHTCPWLLNSKNSIVEVINQKIFPAVPWKIGTTPGYHTPPDVQVEIADCIIEHINMHFKKLSHV